MSCMGIGSGCSFHSEPTDDSIIRLGEALGSSRSHPKATRVEYEVIENMRKQQEVLQANRNSQTSLSAKKVEVWQDLSQTDPED